MKKRHLLIVVVLMLSLSLMLFIQIERVKQIKVNAKIMEQEKSKEIGYHIYKYDNDEGTMLVKIQDKENGINELI